MADATNTKEIEAAEKAFAEAAKGTVSEKAVEKAVTADAPKPAVKTAKVAKAVAAKKKPAKKAPAKKVPAKKAAAKKPAAARPAPARKASPKKIAAKKAARTTPKKKNSNVKETTMAKAKKTETTATNMMADVQERAKAVFGKGGEFAGDLVEFNKANVEAMIESGKIVAEGVQGMGKDYVEDAKSVYGVFTADMKEFASIKSPTDLFQLQGKLARRNFDAAVEFGSKNTEKMVKIANDAVAPISNRVSVAAEKLTKAA